MPTTWRTIRQMTIREDFGRRERRSVHSPEVECIGQADLRAGKAPFSIPDKQFVGCWR